VGTLGSHDVANRPDDACKRALHKLLFELTKEGAKQGLHDHLSGIPIGQADNPGPPDPVVQFHNADADAGYLGFDIVSRNIGGLRHKLSSVLAKGHDITILQEVDLDECHVAELTREAMDAGYHATWGAPTPLNSAGSRVGRRVAIFTKARPVDASPTACEPDPTADYLLASGRWAEAAVDIGEGRRLLVSSLYGISGSSSCAFKRDQTQRLHAAAFSRARSFGAVPYICGADSNILPESLPAVVQARALDIMHDALACAFAGQEVPNTFSSNGGLYPGMCGEGITRIDAVYANRSAYSLLNALMLNFSGAVGSDHVPIVIRLNTRLLNTKITVPVRPRRLKLPDLARMTAAQRKELHSRLALSFDQIAEEAGPQIQQLCQQGDIDAADDAWNSAIERWIVREFADTDDFRHEPPPRGRPLPFREVQACNQWSARLDQTRARAEQKANKLVGAIRDLRARLRRWLKLLPEDHNEDSIAFCCKYCVDQELFKDIKPADVHAAASTLKTIHHSQEEYTERQAEHDGVPSTEQEACPPVGHKVTLSALDKLYAHVTGLVSRDARKRRAAIAERTRAQLDTNDYHTRMELFRRMKRRDGLATPVLTDPKHGGLVTCPLKVAEILQQQWSTFLDRHRLSPPSWQAFKDRFDDGKHFQKFEGAPTRVPSGEELHQSALNGNGRSASGRDGWAPAELRLLPRRAWDLRSTILEACYTTRRFPKSYKAVTVAAIPKGDGSTDPLKQRLLTIFSALYRVEARAWYQLLTPWLVGTLHKDLHGGIPAHECLEASFDAQLELESALLHGSSCVFASYDQLKFFDMFDRGFVHDLLVNHGIPPPLAAMWKDLYNGIDRRVKVGQHYGPSHQAFNGVGQGDPFSLLPALILTSLQFNLITEKWPRLRMGAVIDDRNFRGSYDDIVASLAFIEAFDNAAGHEMQHSKTTFAATSRDLELRLQGLRLGSAGVPPKVCNQTVLVGDVIATNLENLTIEPDKRVEKAIRAVNVILALRTRMASAL